jgi:hypothetical protein
MPVPDFSPGEVLTAAAMDSIGLWLVKTQTIGTAVSSVTVSDAFSADYANYLIKIDGGAASTGNGLELRLLPNTTANDFRYSYLYANLNNTASALSAIGATSLPYVAFSAGQGITAHIEIMSPNAAKGTQVTASGGNSGLGQFFGRQTGVEISSNQFTGFSLTTTTGTLTGGTIRVYGYRN